MDITTAINIKKEKLRIELSKKNPDKQIVWRLKDSLRRHQKEMFKKQRYRAKNWRNKSSKKSNSAGK